MCILFSSLLPRSGIEEYIHSNLIHRKNLFSSKYPTLNFTVSLALPILYLNGKMASILPNILVSQTFYCDLNGNIKCLVLWAIRSYMRSQIEFTTMVNSLLVILLNSSTLFL